MELKKFIYLIIFFSLLGIIDSSYLTYLHYSNSDSSLCNLVGDFKCDIVNKSEFSEVTGILSFFGLYFYIPVPVSALGIIMFILILGICLIYLNKKPVMGYSMGRAILSDSLLFLSVSSIVFSLFLVYVQAVLLKAWCLFCLILDIIVISIFIIALLLKLYKTK